jgi:N-acylneuraminate cytidylyltransferase
MWYVKKGFLQPLLESSLDEPFNQPRQILPDSIWQTGHIDVFWRSTVLRKKSLTGSMVMPIQIEWEYCIDIDNPIDWKKAEESLQNSNLEIDWPDKISNPLPFKPQALILDFDGVMTDNRVWINEMGNESVVCDRGDGMGIEQIKQAGISVTVLSSETNPVVSSRCEKLQIPCLQGVQDKGKGIRLIAEEHGIDLRNTVYIGNDLNDIPCLSHAGFYVAVADAHPGYAGKVDLVLKRNGGSGAVRELCDLILDRIKEKNNYGN